MGPDIIFRGATGQGGAARHPSSHTPSMKLSTYAFQRYGKEVSWEHLMVSGHESPGCPPKGCPIKIHTHLPLPFGTSNQPHKSMEKTSLAKSVRHPREDGHALASSRSCFRWESEPRGSGKKNNLPTNTQNARNAFLKGRKCVFHKTRVSCAGVGTSFGNEVSSAGGER